MHTHPERVNSHLDFRQTTFLNGEDAEHAPKVKHTAGKPRRPSFEPESLLALFGEALAPLVDQLRIIQAQLAAMAGEATKAVIVKEYYSTVEVAKLLGKRPYTVREWCRLGRINAEKANFGRGQDDEWRISHQELTRIQNEGLLRLKREVKVDPPRRLPK
jgi:hypothetical protein